MSEILGPTPEALGPTLNTEAFAAANIGNLAYGVGVGLLVLLGGYVMWKGKFPWQKT